MIPKGVRGNKRSRGEINKIKKRIRALMYSEDPSYSDEEMLAKIKIPERTFYRYKSQIWNADAPKREQMEPILKEKANKRMLSGQKTNPSEIFHKGRTDEQLGEGIASHETGKTAEFVDTSFDTLNKLQHIVEVEVFRAPKPQVMKVSQI
jgi:hypothetical protein